MVTARGVTVEDLLPQVPVLGEGQERKDRGGLRREHPLPLELRRLRGVGRRGDEGRGKAGEVFLAVDHEPEAVRLLQKVVGELQAQGRQLLVDLAEPLLLLGREVRASADEVLVRLLEELLLLDRERERRARLPDCLDAREELLVQEDVVAQRRELRGDLPVDRLERVVRFGAREREEDVAHLREGEPTVLQCLDRVRERGYRGARGDGLDFLLPIGDSGLEGRLVVLGLDPVERRHLEGRRPLLEERVGPRRGLGGGRNGDEQDDHGDGETGSCERHGASPPSFGQSTHVSAFGAVERLMQMKWESPKGGFELANLLPFPAAEKDAKTPQIRHRPRIGRHWKQGPGP